VYTQTIVCKVYSNIFAFWDVKLTGYKTHFGRHKNVAHQGLSVQSSLMYNASMYSKHLKASQSGYRMVAAILFLTFEIQTGYFLTSLDRFGMNKIFFMTLINKAV
jgi:hypothetical protein